MSRRSIHRAWANAQMEEVITKEGSNRFRVPVPTPSKKHQRKPQRVCKVETPDTTLLILSIRPSRIKRALKHYPKGAYVLK